LSRFGWIDFSSTDKEMVAQILAMNNEPGTLDELGVGILRDAYADTLFPGFSTIQTRAKYFITIPRMIRDYWKSDEKKKNKSLVEYLQVREWELTEKLCNLNPNRSDIGIIGGSNYRENKDVARHPSSIYWNGMRVFKLIDTEVSLAEFSRELLKEKRGEQASNEDDGIIDDYMTAKVALGELYDENWFNNLSLQLSYDEADLLKNRILTLPHLKHTVLNQIFEHNLEQEVVKENADGSAKYDFPKLVAYLSNQVSVECKENLSRANEFSCALYGAHLRFNILIAESAGNKDLKDAYEKQFTDWRENYQTIFQPESPDKWCSLLNKRLRPKTRSFIHQWVDLIKNDALIEDLNRCVHKRAIDNKKERSLLNKDLGSKPSWKGMSTLSYRWPQVRIILKDIVEALDA